MLKLEKALLHQKNSFSLDRFGSARFFPQPSVPNPLGDFSILHYKSTTIPTILTIVDGP